MNDMNDMSDKSQTEKNIMSSKTANLKECAMNDDKATEKSVTTIENTGDDHAPDQGPEVPAAALESDYGNALRLLFYFKELIFFHHTEKIWFFWSGKNWQRDSYQSITQMMIEAVKKILSTEIPWLSHLKKNPNNSDIEFPSMKFIGKSFDRSKLTAAVKLAGDLLPIPAALDSHRYLLNCENGTINLNKKKLQEHNQGDFITKIVPVAYDKGATCPQFTAFLEKAFPQNAAGIKYIQKVFGYALTGDVSEKKIFILWGATGNNGKTLLFNVFRGILGACFCVQMASESLVSGRVNAIRSDIAKLIGNRFVTVSETDKKYQFNESLIKLLTGGDAIVARHPHEREIEFTPELKLFIGTNAKPEFTLSDRAMMSRVCIIPFTVSIPPEEQDKQLTQKLIDEEAEGILAWAVEGAYLWAVEGLGDNPFDQDSAAVINPVVTIDQFVETCCDRGQKYSVKSHDLLAAFNQYKIAQGDMTPPHNVKSFGNLLNASNIERDRRSDGIYRLCIELNEAGKALLGEASSPFEETVA